MFPVFLLSFIGLGLSVFVVASVRNTRFGIFHPAAILFSLAALDTFIPGLIWSLLGVPEPPIWQDKADENSLFLGLIYYILFYFIMLFPLVFYRTSRLKITSFDIYRNRLFWLLITTFFLSLGGLWQEIASYGGLSEWFWERSKIRWIGSLSDTSDYGLGALLLVKVPWRVIFNTLVLCGFYFRYELNKKYIYGILFPIMAVLLSLTTFFRGSILLLVFGFAFVEFMRFKKEGNSPKVFAERVSRTHNNTSRKVYFLVGVATALFITYGMVRDYFESISWGVYQSRTSGIYRILSQGSGLDGIGQIVQVYGDHIPYLIGKTYVDMLLLPIPRVIYTSKPEWYGIGDITRRMGWPESTQSAVTIPGEAFANFGWLGLFMAPMFALFFYAIFRVCVKGSSGALLFLYPGVIFYILFISNWMSFTGIMNQAGSFVLVFIVLKILSRT